MRLNVGVIEGNRYVGEAKTTIELNGKQYDARTGKMVGHAVATAKSAKPATTGVNMDGFFRRRSAVPAPAQPVKSAAKTTAKMPRSHRPVTAKRKPERAKTLMRHVVKKPEAAATPKPSETKASGIVLGNPIVKHRADRAHKIPKSPLIQRFSWGGGNSSVAKKVAPLPVTPAPAHAIGSLSAPTIEEAPDLPVPSVAVYKHDPFTAALKKATSHQQHPAAHKKRLHHRIAKKLGVSSRMVNIGAASFALLLLTGFIAYQNAPNFAVRIASSKAGFNARMPGYQPSGFAMNGPIQSSPGKITISFRSNTDSRSFTVTQRPSSWTSESLRDNFVATGSHPFQTYQDKGKTVYVYEGSNATWVNGGVWYQIEGDSSLNSDQLLHIASSM